MQSLTNLGAAAWRLLTDVRFAVVLILLLALSGLVATLVRQFPVSAVEDPARYAAELAAVHQAWDPIAPLGLPVGSLLVGAFDLLGLFRVFSAPWFLLLMATLTVSIVCCTLDRTPRLWRGARDVRVEQPEAFFDPSRGQRAAVELPGRPELADRPALAGGGPGPVDPFRRRRSAPSRRPSGPEASGISGSPRRRARPSSTGIATSTRSWPRC